MARALRIEYEGAFYHITSRGNERKRIFFGKSDYQKFKSYLKEAKEKYGYYLHSFVLMPNHYHLLIETPGANLSKLMHYINSSYTNYINRKKERIGHLFQGRFKAILVDKDNYLLELSRYIHLNPVKARLVGTPQDYTYSSYRSFIHNKREETVSRDLIWSMISNEKQRAPARYRAFVENEIIEELEDPLNGVYGGSILGSKAFIKETLGSLKDIDIFLRREEISHRRRLRSRIEAEDVLNVVSKHFGVSVDNLVLMKGELRGIIIFLIKSYTGMTNKEIGEYFGGLSYSAVGKIKKRFSDKLVEDRSLWKSIKKLKKEMSNVKG